MNAHDATQPPPRRRATPPVFWWTGWAPLVVLPTVAWFAVPPAAPAWVVMWALAFAIYAGCKWLTWRRSPVPDAPAWRHAAYLLAWPGMDARRFLTPSLEPPPPPPSLSERIRYGILTAVLIGLAVKLRLWEPLLLLPEEPGKARKTPRMREWLFATFKLLLGVAVVFGATRAVPSDQPYLLGWVGMIGLMFVLHFGLFHGLSCVWRSLGVAAVPIMNWPIASQGLNEFWGRRWNLAFRDLSHRFLFRPATRVFGATTALLLTFLASGVVHDVVISLPAGGGYGGPTLYFVIQGLGLLVERSRLGQQLGLGRGVNGWLFAAFVLLAPVGLLLHPPFVSGVIAPFIQTITMTTG